MLLEKSKHLEVQIQNREAEIKRLHQKIDCKIFGRFAAYCVLIGDFLIIFVILFRTVGNVNVTKLSTEYELDQ